MDNPAVQAAFNGDFGLLKAELASKGDKAQGFEQYVALAERAYKAEAEASAAREAEVGQAILSVFDGKEEGWNEVREWVKKEADPAEKASFQAMLKSGDKFQAQAAAFYLNHLYQTAHGVVREPSPTSAGPQPTASVGSSALNPDEFRAEVSKLYASMGALADKSPEMAALLKRREAYRGK